MDTTGMLRLEREGALYRDRTSLYQVVLDGTPIAVMANGEARTFPVEPGRHTLWLGVSGGSSLAVPFSARAGVTTAFRCRAEGVLSYLWRLAWGRDRHIVVEPDPTAYRPSTEAGTSPRRLAS